MFTPKKIPIDFVEDLTRNLYLLPSLPENNKLLLVAQLLLRLMNKILLTGTDVDTHIILNRVQKAAYRVDFLKEATEIVEDRIDAPDVFILIRQYLSLMGSRCQIFCEPRRRLRIFQSSCFPLILNYSTELSALESMNSCVNLLLRINF